MAKFHAAVGKEASFLEELFDHGLLLRTGAPGLYGRGPVFEDVRERFDALVTRAAAPAGSETLRFPPLLPRRQLESAEYLNAFPHLAGTIFAFEGSEAHAVEQADGVCPHQLPRPTGIHVSTSPRRAARMTRARKSSGL